MFRAIPVVLSLVGTAVAGTSATAVAFYRLNALEEFAHAHQAIQDQDHDRLARMETKLDMLLEALRAR